MTESEFKQQKARRIESIENRITMLNDGTLLKSFELELMLANRQTFESIGKNHRFITN